MCRSIQPLFNVEPAMNDDDVRAAALQFVRKISGFRTPSAANDTAFHAAVDAIAATSTELLRSLRTSAPPKSRIEEARKAKRRAGLRADRAARELQSWF